MSYCLRIVGEELLELAGRFKETLAVHFETASGVIESGLFAEAGEGVGEETVSGAGIERSVAGEKGELEVLAEVAHELVASLLAPAVVPEDGEGDVVRAEDVFEGDGGGEEFLAGEFIE